MNRRSFWGHSRLRLVLFCAVILAASCKTAGFGFKTINISGMVYDFSNRPVPYCEVSLGRWHKSSTDINGRFTLSKVSAGTYTITGAKKGFEFFSEEVTIGDPGQIIYLRVPSQNQLLNLVDESLTANNFTQAEAFAERAYQIDKNNLETLFYYATVKFRQGNYGDAASFLETAVNFGSKDLYVNKFLTLLKETRNED